jgi:hypothetical protein
MTVGTFLVFALPNIDEMACRPYTESADKPNP